MATIHSHADLHRTASGELIITRRLLHAWSACKGQRALFTKTFGPNARVAITEENAIKAADAGLDLFWIANQLLAAAALVSFHQELFTLNNTRTQNENAAYEQYECGTINSHELDQHRSASHDTYLHAVATLIVRLYHQQETAK